MLIDKAAWQNIYNTRRNNLSGFKRYHGYRGFGDYSDPTEVNAAADQLVSQMQNLYDNAVNATYWVSSDNANSTQANLINNYQPMVLQQWAVTQRGWAADGSGGPNGTYDWARWFADGQGHAQSLSQLTQTLGDASVFSAATGIVSGMASTIATGIAAAGKVASAVASACAADPSKCNPATAINASIPFWMKAVAVIGVIGYATGKFR